MADPPVPPHIKKYIDEQVRDLWTKVNNMALEEIDKLRKELNTTWTNTNNLALVRIDELRKELIATSTDVNNKAYAPIKALQKEAGDHNKLITDMHDEMHRIPDGILQRLGRLEKS